jgi:two-component system sensor histidine kinase PilS (NtrC family)
MRYFGLYRIVLTGLFAVMLASDNLPSPLGETDMGLFSVTSIAYFAGAIVLFAALEYRLLAYPLQVYIQVIADVIAITLIMHASGGVRSGLGILLVVSVAGTSLLSSGRMAVMSAAAATLAVLAETGVSSSFLGLPVDSTQAGVLGAAMFATAFIGYALAERAQVSEALAARQALDIASLSKLNEHIVQRMRSGVIVVDALGQVVMLNAAARYMLGASSDSIGKTLADIAPGLEAAYQHWLGRGENPLQPLGTKARTLEVMASFTRLGGDTSAGALVYLEDAAEMRQRAQQLKLASLGRLTASIAHEIRNPLGAISHAGQLLSESSSLSASDRRLTDIIAQHSRRMNAIIEDVLAVGRRNTAISETIDLKTWLLEFVEELVERRGLAQQDVLANFRADTVTVRIDKDQLYQIVWNLVENALRYSRQRPLIEFECGVFHESERPYLEIKDSGPGMTREVADQAFEPFFTSEAGGTGLGLYIARELCESNQASLALVEHGGDGCRFRLTFAHPERRQVAA